MHLRKKIFIVLFTAFMCFALVSCKTAPAIQESLPTPTPTSTPTPTPTATPLPTPTPTPEPSAAPFSLGVGDEIGYLSKYFDFGFRLPEGWMAYDRNYIDLANMIKADGSDPEAYEKEYQTLLKSGQTLYDYCGYNKSANEMILVMLKDNPDMVPEQEAVEAYAASLCDIGGDGTIDALNIRNDTVMIGDTEHPMTRFELPLDSAYGYGAVFAVQKDGTIAYVNIMCPKEQMVQDVIDSLYQYSDFPSVEAYNIPEIGNAGYYSRFLNLRFDLPPEWANYSRKELEEYNEITLKETGKDALRNAYQDLLKSGDLILDYWGYEKDMQHLVFIYTANATGNWMESISGRGFFDTLLPWLLDFDKDGNVDVLNGSFSQETVLGQDSFVYRFDDRKGTSGVLGMVFTYRRGSTFVGIEIASVVPGAIDQILSMFRTSAH